MSEMIEKDPNFPDPLPQSVLKNLEATSRITESIQPVLRQQEIIQNFAETVKLSLHKMDFYLPAVEIAKQIQIPVMRMSEVFSGYQLNSALTSSLQALNQALDTSVLRNFSQSILNASAVLCETIKNISPPFVEWISTFDYSPLRQVIESLNIAALDSIRKRREELHRAYLQAMYDCEWFPYAGAMASLSLFREINEIIATSRGNSKRRKNRVDKAILSYYTPTVIKGIKRTWRNSDLEPYMKRMLCQAIEAHLRGEYILTITCLSTMWEGLIHYKTNVMGRRNCTKTKEDFVKLVQENDYAPIFSDYYENFIVSQVNTKADVIDGVPNRNGVSHGKYNKYPNKKASLNAILLTDFIIGLRPKELEEEDDGQA